MLDPQPEHLKHRTSPGDPPGSASRDAPLSHARPAPRRAAWADLGRVQAMIEALPEAVIVTEHDGELRFTNTAADRLFEGQPIHDRADLLSRFEEVGPDLPGRRAATAPVAATQRAMTVRPRDQPNRWFALRTVALEDDAALETGGAFDAATGATPEGGRDVGGRPGQTAFVLRDVTDSRDLRPLREAFLAVLSHELRTPITTIYAGSAVLARRATLSPPATQTLARDISAEAARLYDLVEDLLVLARLERQVLDPLDEPVLVQRSVDSTLRTLGARLPDAPIELVGEADVPPAHGDATYVEQACRNLLMTSIRYAGSAPGRQLVVELRADHAAGEVLVAVRDRGPQLSLDELARTFELPDASALGRLAGAGVGPFVTRHLVEAMGGRVWARNRPGGGLEMGFALRIDSRC